MQLNYGVHFSAARSDTALGLTRKRVGQDNVGLPGKWPRPILVCEINSGTNVWYCHVIEREGYVGEHHIIAARLTTRYYSTQCITPSPEGSLTYIKDIQNVVNGFLKN